MTERLVITSAGTEVELLPERGGAIGRYHTRIGDKDFPWFAAMPDGVACFPMVPFCSRIGEAAFDFDGRHIRLSPNNPPERHAIHGHGFQRAWEVQKHRRDQAVLSYTHESGEWPWRYCVEMRITIEDMDLCVAMTLTNLDDVAMPYGLGLHPYLTLSNGTTVKARVDGIWELDEELVGLGRKTLETGPLELRPAEENLDAAYAGWTGEAGVVWPELGASLILTASAADTLVLYSPRGASFVCVEPLSNAPNGFNLSDQPADFYRVLSAGAVVTERWRFAPQLGSEVLPG